MPTASPTDSEAPSPAGEFLGLGPPILVALGVGLLLLLASLALVGRRALAR